MPISKLRGPLLAFGLPIMLICAFAWLLARAPLFPATVETVASVPAGYDPLTAHEVNAMIAAAVQADAMESPRGAASTPQEVLLVERREASKAAYASGSWPRQADVYRYDYATDTLIHTVVEVQNSVVLTIEHLQDVQLPLTAAEEQRALALIRADAALWTELAERYQTITSESLQSLDQLQVKVSVFQADVMPDGLNAAAQLCGRRRCAQVLLFTVEKTLLEMTPIVDLSHGQVVQVLSEE
jgi:Cu2+-containing amine oxidase